MKKRKMDEKEKAFVRGYAAACAEFLRHHVNVEDLLRAANITHGVLKEADVDEYDAKELKPVIKQINAVTRRLRRKAA